MKRKNSVYIISSLILLTSVIFLMIYHKPHRSVIKEEAAFTLSVSQLVNAFLKDESDANELYLGKVLEVQGVLKEIILNDSNLILLLGDSTQMTGVSCYLQKDQKDKYTTLKRGESVKVKGICNGMLLDVVLDKCIMFPGE
jgi:hypothetical protein